MTQEAGVTHEAHTAQVKNLWYGTRSTHDTWSTYSTGEEFMMIWYTKHAWHIKHIQHGFSMIWYRKHMKHVQHRWSNCDSTRSTYDTRSTHSTGEDFVMIWFRKHITQEARVTHEAHTIQHRAQRIAMLKSTWTTVKWIFTLTINKKSTEQTKHNDTAHTYDTLVHFLPYNKPLMWKRKRLKSKR